MCGCQRLLMCPEARLHACAKALALRRAHPARCVPAGARRGAPARGRVRLARADAGAGERGAAPRPRAGEAGPPARNRAGGARRTVTGPPLIAHAECAAIAPCSCGIRRTAPGKARNSRREIAAILLVPGGRKWLMVGEYRASVVVYPEIGENKKGK